jgi:hypothetical protein
MSIAAKSGGGRACRGKNPSRMLTVLPYLLVSYARSKCTILPYPVFGEQFNVNALSALASKKEFILTKKICISLSLENLKMNT